MAEGYCLFHNAYMDSEKVKTKSCRRKDNSNEKCRHFIELNKQDYRNKPKHFLKHKGVRR